MSLLSLTSVAVQEGNHGCLVTEEEGLASLRSTCVADRTSQGDCLKLTLSENKNER